MDSDEELPFSDSEAKPSPAPQRKLKRLRKATDKVSKDLPSSSSDDVDSGHEVDSPRNEGIDRGEADKEGPEVLSPRSGSKLRVIELELEVDGGFESEEVRPGVKRHLEFDSLSEELGGKGEDKLDEEVEDLRTNEGSEKKWRSLDGLEVVDSGVKRHLGFDSFSEEFDGEGGDKLDAGMEESEGLGPNEWSEKKRKNLDGSEETGEKNWKTKKKKKVKDAGAGYDENLFSDVSPKRIGKKERRERLKELRAESQRLLRETREASFKPVPIVQKSVSSVLEKIRQRKLELSIKLVNMSESLYTDGNDTFSREVHKDADEDREELTSIPVDVEEAQDVQGSKETSNESDENEILRTALADDLKQTFRAPVEDTQDLIFDSLSSDSKDEIPSSPLDDVLAPSLVEMNLKFDSALPNDFSDDEEGNNKNIDPLQHGSADLNSSHKGDPVKAFVDDEAEEEDDSDDDRARFQNNEENDDNDSDIEELNDMIAPTYDEKPVDNDMRNHLHQKWLEQQDDVGLENLLQKLKCGSKQKETAFMEEREDEDTEAREDGESEDESDDDPVEGLITRNIIRMNLKKAKEMIPLMFTDKDDVYVSSDDEETEKTSLKRHFSHKAEEHSTFLSPAEDASSKNVFGLIKKLNGAPDARRKAKIASYPNTLSSKTTSSKLSFLSRGSRNSLPSLQKPGSSTVRSFIFERDDSNSRSAILMTEDSSDTVQWENRPKKAATAKFSNSQSQVRSSQTTQAKPENDSGPSLHEILRCPSIKSSHRSGDMGGQVEAIYAAFKLDHYPSIKKEPALSLRTA